MGIGVRALQAGRPRPPLTLDRRWRATAACTTVAVVVGVDAATKAWARGLTHPVHVFGPVQLVHATNDGAAFSLLHGGGGPLGWLSAIACLVLVVAIVLVERRSLVVALSLVLGGAIGNGIERLTSAHHRVTDLVDLRIWPVFNVADACVTVGCMWIVLDQLTVRRDRGA